MKPPVRIVPPTLPRPFGGCASGEAREGKRALSDAEVTLVTALEALKDVHAALVAAQLAVQSTVRSAQAVAMPAWTSVGSTSAGSGEAGLVRNSGLSEFLAEHVGGIERSPCTFWPHSTAHTGLVAAKGEATEAAPAIIPDDQQNTHTQNVIVTSAPW